MTSTALPTEMWVKLKSGDSAAVSQAVLVSTQDCDNVDDFIKAIKKELSPKLDQVAVHRITLHVNKDSPALRPGLALGAILSQSGFINNDESPLLVSVPLPTAPSSAPLMKAGRQASLKRLSVEASCRKFLDAVAFKLSTLYWFPRAHQSGPTIGDVIHAAFPPARADDEEDNGPSWSFHIELKDHYRMDDENFETLIKKGTSFTETPLPDVFSPQEWRKLREFNNKTSKRVHDGLLPTLSNGRPYIVLPHADYTPEMISFLQEIAIKAYIISEPSMLVVKDEDVLSKGSSLA